MTPPRYYNRTIRNSILRLGNITSILVRIRLASDTATWLATSVMIGFARCHSVLFIGASSIGVGGKNQRFGRSCLFLSSQAPDYPPPKLSDKIILDPKAIQLKDDLVAIAASTKRGFSASRKDRDAVRKIVNDLSAYSPSGDPAAAYYKDRKEDSSEIIGSTIAGKWTLVYTDAPDITSLDGGPLSTAKLGKIGQECSPPYINNVIEWKRPDWAASLPFSGGDSSRVLQKVCCEASASPENPSFVDLKLVGLELNGASNVDESKIEESGWSGLSNKLLNGPAGLLEGNPINLRGPLTAPFGRFEIMFLDDNMRITRTNQGFIAVNARDKTEWF